MKTIVLFALSLLLTNCIFGQSTSPEVIAGAGTHSTTANSQVSWTVGEVVTQTLSSGTNTATQGFHQTLITVTAIDPPMADFHVEVFPNPASTVLNVRFKTSTTTKLELVDMHGRSVLAGEPTEADVRTLDVTALSQGVYILRVQGEAPAQIQKFKIQVVHSLQR